jgi:cytochrome c oxidase subunit 2
MIPGASAHAADVDLVLLLVHALMAVLFAGWGGYFLWVLWRFSRRRQPQANHAGATGRFAFWTEVGIVAVEGVLLVAIALPIWFQQTAAAPDATDRLVVRVVAEQFQWNMHYPGTDGRFGETSVTLVDPETNPVGLDRASPFGADDIVLPGELHLPVNRPVTIQLSSKDVIHSFGVHAMRVKQDAIPGLLSPMWFTPTRTGTFEIACSQLCGLGHYRMRGLVIVESEADFAEWLETEAARLPAPR